MGCCGGLGAIGAFSWTGKMAEFSCVIMFCVPNLYAACHRLCLYVLASGPGMFDLGYACSVL